MNDASTTKKDANTKEKPELGKIEPIQKEVGSIEVEPDTVIHPGILSDDQKEKSLISTSQLLLREYGIRKSGAGIRDAVEIPQDIFGPKQCVSALMSLGFKASFGSIKVSKIGNHLLPLIAFTKDGGSVLVKEINDDGFIEICFPDKNTKASAIELSEFQKNFSGYVVLAKQLNSREKEELSGHWFFSAFRKSKWLYVQVLIAAMVSNFLSLTTAIFTMTVYDRIIPNGAFESLVALSIGVVIALVFDF